MKSVVRWAGLCLLVATWLSGCGVAVMGGDQGTESHWLSECKTDADCWAGSCLCGVCTTPCAAISDCPYPLDRCTAPGEAPIGGTCTTPADSGLCSASDLELVTSQSNLVSAVSCDGGRVSHLHLQRSIERAGSAVALNDGGYALFGGTAGKRVTFVDGDGNVLRVVPVPSDEVTELRDMVQLPDGSFVLAGTKTGEIRDDGWFGFVTADWRLRQEGSPGQVGVDSISLAALSDGSVIVATSTSEQGFSGDPAVKPGLFWKRMSAAGELLSDTRYAEIEGFENTSRKRIVVATLGQAFRIVVPTTNGFVMIPVDQSGNAGDSVLLDTPPGFYPSDIAALPGERLAIAYDYGGPVLTVVGPDGAIAWEKVFGAANGDEFASGGRSSTTPRAMSWSWRVVTVVATTAACLARG